MYALNLSEDGRILSATYPQFAPVGAIIVEKLPDGDISDYCYVNDEYIYDPIPKEELEQKPSQLDILEAKVTYIAMMTDLMEVV